MVSSGPVVFGETILAVLQEAYSQAAPGPSVDGVVHRAEARAEAGHQGQETGGLQAQPFGPHRRTEFFRREDQQAVLAEVLPPNVRHLVPGKIRAIQGERL